MSLDNIQMPPVLVQDLYKKSLVELDSIQQNTIAASNPEWPVLGANSKWILLIVNEKDAAFLPEEDLAFLMRILTPCNLSMSDVAILNYSRIPGMQYEEMMKRFSPDKIIFFDVDPANLGFPLHFPHYKVQQYNNQSYLCAPSLKILSAQKDQKLLLWNCLKIMFSL